MFGPLALNENCRFRFHSRSGIRPQDVPRASYCHQLSAPGPYPWGAGASASARLQRPFSRSKVSSHRMKSTIRESFGASSPFALSRQMSSQQSTAIERLLQLDDNSLMGSLKSSLDSVQIWYFIFAFIFDRLTSFFTRGCLKQQRARRRLVGGVSLNVIFCNPYLFSMSWSPFSNSGTSRHPRNYTQRLSARQRGSSQEYHQCGSPLLSLNFAAPGSSGSAFRRIWVQLNFACKYCRCGSSLTAKLPFPSLGFHDRSLRTHWKCWGWKLRTSKFLHFGIWLSRFTVHCSLFVSGRFYLNHTHWTPFISFLLL